MALRLSSWLIGRSRGGQEMAVAVPGRAQFARQRAGVSRRLSRWQRGCVARRRRRPLCTAKDSRRRARRGEESRASRRKRGRRS